MSYESDRVLTLRNRNLILKNTNLLYWYENLFKQQLGEDNIRNGKILEIGSGTSPIKSFFPNVTTSDVLDLDYVDYIFDCHRLHSFDAISDHSLDAIIMTNVLHHLKEPVRFLQNAAVKLKQGGVISATEPYLSFFSKFIYNYIHHETMDLTIEKPILTDDNGPLSSANIALPYLLFFKRDNWITDLKKIYTCTQPSYYTSSAYFATGGISRKIPISHRIYRSLFAFDCMIANNFPHIMAAFFTIKLIKK